VKAISLHQPYATLVAIGFKHIETRSWRTLHRGPLAIQASLVVPPEMEALWRRPAVRAALEAAGYSDPEALPLGAVVALCRLTDCTPVGALLPLRDGEGLVGDFTPGRFGWCLEDVQRLCRPIPVSGRLGVWEWREGEALISGALRAGASLQVAP
jgi:hypothetical protein